MLLRQETNAIVSALKWQETIGFSIGDSSQLRFHLSRGTLGSKVQSQWPYPALRYVSAVETDKFVNSHLNSVFPVIVGNSANGAIKPYSLAEVRVRNARMYNTLVHLTCLQACQMNLRAVVE